MSCKNFRPIQCLRIFSAVWIYTYVCVYIYIYIHIYIYVYTYVYIYIPSAGVKWNKNKLFFDLTFYFQFILFSIIIYLFYHIFYVYFIANIIYTYILCISHNSGKITACFSCGLNFKKLRRSLSFVEKIDTIL